MKLVFEVPIRVRSEMNERGHFMSRASHFKRHRRDVALAFRAAAGPPPHRYGVPATVTLTRIAPRPIVDAHDNLRSGFKGVVDEVAACCGWDDGDPRITWNYAQERGRLYGARIEIEATLATEHHGRGRPRETHCYMGHDKKGKRDCRDCEKIRRQHRKHRQAVQCTKNSERS